MALAMLLGNVNHFSVSLLSPGNTLAALIANDFPEAAPSELDVLLFAGMTLLAITLVVNILGALAIQFANRGTGGRP
jgi:phosphate transport system permease protein